MPVFFVSGKATITRTETVEIDKWIAAATEEAAAILALMAMIRDKGASGGEWEHHPEVKLAPEESNIRRSSP